MCKVITIANQKGGVAKTTTCANLGSALATRGNRVLMVDFDPQGNLSMAFGIENPGKLAYSMHDIISFILDNEDEDTQMPNKDKYIIHSNNLHIIPCNTNLVLSEINLSNVVGGEFTLKELLDPLRKDYDYIIIDTNPSLGKLTINALTACDDVIIPVSPQLWSATGLTDLLQSIFRIKKKINPKLSIMGILLTICDERTRLYKEAKGLLEDNYKDKIRIFNTNIPNTVKVGEANYLSKSVIDYDVNSKASAAYRDFAEEVLNYV